MLPWIIGGVVIAAAGAIASAMSDDDNEEKSGSSVETTERVVSQTYSKSAKEYEAERIATIKQEIKEYKAKIKKNLKNSFEVEVTIKKGKILVQNDNFVARENQKKELLQKEYDDLMKLKQKLGEYNV
jgi:hypothetical protein